MFSYFKIFLLFVIGYVVVVGDGVEGVIVVVVVVKGSVVRCLFNRNCKLQLPVKL